VQDSLADRTQPRGDGLKGTYQGSPGRRDSADIAEQPGKTLDWPCHLFSIAAGLAQLAASIRKERCACLPVLRAAPYCRNDSVNILKFLPDHVRWKGRVVLAAVYGHIACDVSYITVLAADVEDRVRALAGHDQSAPRRRASFLAPLRTMRPKMKSAMPSRFMNTAIPNSGMNSAGR